MASCSSTQALYVNPSLLPSLFKTMCGASVTLSDIREDAIHSGNIQCTLYVVYPDLSNEYIVLQLPSQPNYLSHGYGFTANSAFINPGVVNLKVITSGSADCIQSCQGTIQDTRPCCSGLTKDTATGVCSPGWACRQPLDGYEINGCGQSRLNPSCNPVGGSFSLKADKTSVKPGDTVVFTTTGQDGSIWLYEKGLLGDYSNKIGVADAINGVATFTINPAGTHAYKAAHNPVPGANDCTLLCSWSNEVNVSTGTDLMMIAVYGIAAIVATIIASQFIGGRK